MILIVPSFAPSDIESTSLSISSLLGRYRIEELKKLLQKDGIQMADPPNISYSGFSPPYVVSR